MSVCGACDELATKSGCTPTLCPDNKFQIHHGPRQDKGVTK